MRYGVYMDGALSRSHLGRTGGLARIEKRGNPGTPAGRRLGGLHSLKTHRALETRFKLLRKVTFPKRSAELAEMIGIFMGDGHMGEYQSTIVTNSETDLGHAKYIRNLIEGLFNMSVSFRIRPDRKACVLVVSSKEFCRYLRQQGMTGNKVRHGVTIPEWIKRNDEYANVFIRGLFDTDGCVFLDTHRIKGRIYHHLGMAFTNRTLSLLSYFKTRLEALGLHPTQKTPFTVFLRREEEIRRYFELIGTSNPKHTSRFQECLRIRQGGVA